MADVQVNVKVDAKEADESIKGLTRQLKALREQQAKLPEGSAAWKKLGQDINELEGRLGDLNDRFNTLRGSGVERLQSSFGLLREGLTSADFGKAKIALQGIGQAMSAIPVLLIVTGIMKLIENFDKLKNSSGLIGKAFTALGDVIDFVGDKFTDFLDLINVIDKDLDKISEQIDKNATMLNGLLDDQIRQRENQIKLLQAQGKDTVNLEKEKQAVIIATNKLIIQQIEASIAAGNKLTEDQQKRLNDARIAIQQAQVEGQIIEAKAEQDKIKKNKELAKQIVADEKTLREKIEQLRIESIKSEEQRDIEKAKYEKEKALEELKNLKASEETKAAMRIQINTKFLNDLEMAEAKEAERQKKINEEKAKTEEELQKKLDEIKRKETEEQEKRIEKQLNDDIEAANKRIELARKEALEKAQIAQDSLTSIQALSDIFFAIQQSQNKEGTAEYEKNAKKQFEINKALQIGAAIINGIQSVLAITSVPDFTLGVASAARIAAQIALNAASIAKIATTKYKSTSTGGGGNPSTPRNNNTPNVNTPTPPQAQLPNQQGTFIQDQRVYVLESDISKAQSRVTRVEEQAKF